MDDVASLREIYREASTEQLLAAGESSLFPYVELKTRLGRGEESGLFYRLLREYARLISAGRQQGFQLIFEEVLQYAETLNKLVDNILVYDAAGTHQEDQARFELGRMMLQSSLESENPYRMGDLEGWKLLNTLERAYGQTGYAVQTLGYERIYPLAVYINMLQHLRDDPRLRRDVARCMVAYAVGTPVIQRDRHGNFSTLYHPHMDQEFSEVLLDGDLVAAIRQALADPGTHEAWLAQAVHDDPQIVADKITLYITEFGGLDIADLLGRWAYVVRARMPFLISSFPADPGSLIFYLEAHQEMLMRFERTYQGYFDPERQEAAYQEYLREEIILPPPSTALIPALFFANRGNVAEIDFHWRLRHYPTSDFYEAFAGLSDGHPFGEILGEFFHTERSLIAALGIPPRIMDLFTIGLHDSRTACMVYSSCALIPLDEESLTEVTRRFMEDIQRGDVLSIDHTPQIFHQMALTAPIYRGILQDIKGNHLTSHQLLIVANAVIFGDLSTLPEVGLVVEGLPPDQLEILRRELATAQGALGRILVSNRLMTLPQLQSELNQAHHTRDVTPFAQLVSTLLSEVGVNSPKLLDVLLGGMYQR